MRTFSLAGPRGVRTTEAPGEKSAIEGQLPVASIYMQAIILLRPTAAAGARLASNIPPTLTSLGCSLGCVSKAWQANDRYEMLWPNFWTRELASLLSSWPLRITPD